MNFFRAKSFTRDVQSVSICVYAALNGTLSGSMRFTLDLSRHYATKKSRSILLRLPLLAAHWHRLPVIEPSYLIEQPQHLGILIVTFVPQQDKGELQLLIERFRQGQWPGDQIGMIFRCMSGAIRGGRPRSDRCQAGMRCAMTAQSWIP